MDNICAPNRYDPEHKTCFNTDQLVEMAKGYNRYITKNKLSPSNVKKIDISLINVKKNKKYLLEELLKRFKQVCGKNQFCLTKQDFMNEIVKEMREDIDNNTFRPEGPKDPSEWLSTIDINNIMKQYENIYSDFKFFGAVPLNCNEISFCSLYKLNFEKYNRDGIKKLAIVFNHDKYGQPGSHWVALYMDLDMGEIYYCDSTGKKAFGNIEQIIDQFMKYYKKKTGQNAVYKFNTTPYQKDSSECGIYSCNFIIRMLNGESFEDVINGALEYEQINSCRNKYFSNKPSKYTPHKKCDPTSHA